MLFTSAPFLIYFMPVALLGFQWTGRFGRRAVISWLVLVSLVFYGYWNPRFVVVLVSSLVFNFVMSRLIARSRREVTKTYFMGLGVAVNLMALCYYKYLFPSLNFLNSIGAGRRPWKEVILPLGISFFTFTQIAYLVDLSEEEAAPQSLLDYAMFVTFFPHLIAGPILHHREIMPQLAEERRFDLSSGDLLLGLSWFATGLAKKTIIADRLASVVEPFFRHVPHLSMSESWIAALTYSMQLYFDFSGYSDMAIGLARMFSIEFPLNFNSPYKASSIIDFWARWHMTLTRYLTLYIYNPLALAVNRSRQKQGKPVSRKAQRTAGGFAAMIAWPTFATMLLAGIWHGAGPQFLVFGLLHGSYITVNHAWRGYTHQWKGTRTSKWWAHPGSVALTYVCVLIGQIVFRASTLKDAGTLLGNMTGLHRASIGHALPPVSWSLLILFPVVWFLPNTQQLLKQVVDGTQRTGLWRHLQYSPSWGWSLSMGLLLLAAILFSSDYATFLYFQF